MPAAVSDPADWSAYADVPLLHTIASAVIGLADVEGLASFHLPYPAEAQRALDRLVLACLLRGVELRCSISTPQIIALITPHASQTATIAIQLAIFAIAAVPGYVLAIARMDRFGHRRLQLAGFIMMGACFAVIGLVPGMTTAVVPFLLASANTVSGSSPAATSMASRCSAAWVSASSRSSPAARALATAITATARPYPLIDLERRPARVGWSKLRCIRHSCAVSPGARPDFREWMRRSVFSQHHLG